MPLKMPTKISLKWWQDNYPNSLPTNKEVEALLKEASSATRADFIKQLKAMLAKSDEMPKLDQLKPNYAALLEVLKRSKATVTKDKTSHKDFLKGIDEMIELVRDEKAALSEEVDKLMSERRQAQSLGRTLENEVAAMDKDYATPLKRMTATLKAIAAGLASADEDELAQMIGRNRFMQATIKDMQRKAKALESALAPHAKVELASDARLRVLDVMIDMKDLQKVAQALDKNLVMRAVALLGDVKGKKLFLGTEARKVHLE